MELIVSHRLTDFDGLGAMVAAKKLYPDAEAVIIDRMHRLVKDFMVLYKDEVDIKTLSDITFKEIDKIIIVDTNQKKLLGRLNKEVNWDKCQVILYDHHEHDTLDWVDLDLSQDVGAATTILINKIIAEKKELNPLEATICALGIYADTGNLTFLNTTSADAKALSFLLESGANLHLVNDFIKESLNKEQQSLLEDLIDTREDIHIDGIEVSIFSIKYDKYIPGINRVVEQLKLIYHLDSLFVLVEMKDKVQLIGRSGDEAVDIGQICSAFGGGGHSGAGAARLEDCQLEQAVSKLKDLIDKYVHPLKRVRSIMSSPVRTVNPKTSIKEVSEFMKKYGHNGVVVYNQDEIMGIFSRRDLNKVKGHGLMHAPVKAYMTRDVITIDVEAPVHKAQDMMVKYGIGRIPVTEENKLVGIITRSDILASYYGGETPYQHKNRYGSSLVEIKKSEKDIKSKINILTEKIIYILKITGKTAVQHGADAYLIGGMIRDMLLGKINKDIDVVFEGNLRLFINDLADKLNGDWSYNEKFRTGTINLDNNFNLDLASTRKELYHYTGALPEVEKTNILEDLFRRDFTVNVLALDITPDNWGQLIDFFNGEKDLEDGLLRALHRFSFLDDPTRIIRGIRLAVKLNFKFEEETKGLIKEALATGDFSRLSTARVLKEIKLLFKQKITPRFIKILKDISMFKLLKLDITLDSRLVKQTKRLETFLEYLRKKNYNIEDWIVRFALFTEQIKYQKIADWSLKEKYKKVLTTYNRNQNLLQKLDKDDMDPVRLVNLLDQLIQEELVVLYIKTDNKLILDYLENLSNVEIEVDGFDLQDMGMEPGPRMKKILNKIYKAKLRGEITSRDEELDVARELIKKWSFKNN
ncbi:MAG: CBS domain-containing protein [Halothermotrichaceae bacterium]